MRSIRDRVAQTIDRYRMLEPGDKVVVGVSGGPDSVVLLSILCLLREQYRFSLVIAHVNHCLRGEESDLDQEFVQNLAKKMEVEVFCERANVQGFQKKHRISKQTAGREIRYAFFQEITERLGATKIALGHTLDDQAETVLMRILRGTGVHGLSGIPPVREGKIIRPLFGLKKSEILRFLTKKKIAFRNDPSNQENAYTRNKVRNHLIPLLTAEYNPNITNVLVSLGETALSDEDLLQSITRKAMDDILIRKGAIVELKRDRFLSLHVGLQRRIVRESIKTLKGDLKRIAFIHTEMILELIKRGRTGKSLHLPGGVTGTIQYGVLVLSKREAPLRTGFSHHVPLEGEILISEASLKISFHVLDPTEENPADPGSASELFDLDLIERPLTVRSREDGDVFAPGGMNGKKKIKKFFIDMKMPKDERDSTPLLVSGKNILWVIGLRRSSLARVTSQTKKVLSVRAYKNK